MASLTVPAIEVSASQGWSEQDRNLYNKLPFYLNKMVLEYLKTWSIWPKLVGKKKWTPNMGDTMRSVSKEPSPHMRQVAFPQKLNGTSNKDIMDVRERSVDAQVYKHRFESTNLNFVPNFQDFLTDHVDRTIQDIGEKISRFNDLYIRSNIFSQSPYVFIPNASAGELISAPYDVNPTMTYDSATKKTTISGVGKTSGYLQTITKSLGNPGNLSLNAINLAATIMETDMGIKPFQGSGGPSGDNAPTDSKYVLVCSGEAYNQFIYDPWLLKNKNIELDVIKEGFRGSLFGRVTCKLESLPCRINADGTLSDPEVRELNSDMFNFGESIPNPDYVNAPYEVAWLIGYGQGYKAIEVGPPPRDFAGGGVPKGYGQMFWNGEVTMTKNIFIPVYDANGNIIAWEPNKYGEFLQLISQCTFGIIGEQRRSIIPIIYKRTRGAHAS